MLTARAASHAQFRLDTPFTTCALKMPPSRSTDGPSTPRARTTSGLVRVRILGYARTMIIYFIDADRSGHTYGVCTAHPLPAFQ